MSGSRAPISVLLPSRRSQAQHQHHLSFHQATILHGTSDIIANSQSGHQETVTTYSDFPQCFSSDLGVCSTVWLRGFISHSIILTRTVAVLLINAVAILSEDRFLARSTTSLPALPHIHWQGCATAIIFFAPRIRALQANYPEATSVHTLTRYK